MDAPVKRFGFFASGVALLGLPVLLWAAGETPRRSVLMEVLSVLTILSLVLMLGQFYLSRGNRGAVRTMKLGGVMRYHKAIGYGFVGVLLVHPFFVILPRFFEVGVDPSDAFLTMVTSFESLGIVLGLAAWLLLAVILITSLVRDRLPLKYSAWRLLHGVLSVLFVLVATWHAIDLGRHTNLFLSVFFVVVALGGMVFLVKAYVADASGLGRHGHE